jgi:hypothetical protein
MVSGETNKNKKTNYILLTKDGLTSEYRMVRNITYIPVDFVPRV